MQSDSNNINLLSFQFLKCFAKVSDYRAVGLSNRRTIETHPDQRPTRPAVPTLETQDTQNQRSDLADTFNLFKSYLDNKLEPLKVEPLCSGNDLEVLTKTIKELSV